MVVFPDPVGPTKKTNSFLSTEKETSEMPYAPVPNFLETLSRLIIQAPRLCLRPLTNRRIELFEFLPKPLFFFQGKARDLL